MPIIERIKIERFRSCRNVSIVDLQGISCLSGRNNSGKSNLLRALSAFFTDEVEPGLPVNINRDCNSRPKEKKRISISVSFNIDESVGIQKTLKTLITVIPRKCEIKKEYTIDKASSSGYSIDYYIDGNKLDTDNRQHVDVFLNLFNFRYITSDRTPRKVLEANLVELQSELKFRLRPKADQSIIQANIMEEIKKSIHNLFEPVASELSKADKTISHVEMIIPDELTELLNSTTYLIQTIDGSRFNERDQGNGIQNLLLFSILYLVDRNFHRKFGWKIATIWAIEEPEIFLHYDLENQLAGYFRRIVAEYEQRFQIIMSSHSSVFPQYADAHFYIDRTTDTTGHMWTDCKKLEIHKFISHLYKNRITSVSHLITLYPESVIVLVEGEIDEYIFQNAIEQKSERKQIRVFSVSRFLNNTVQKGCQVLLDFLGINRDLVNLRTKYGIAAIFDWDVDKAKVNRLRKKIREPSKIIQLDISQANPLLDKSFRGIERYYSEGVVREVMYENTGLITDRGTMKVTDRYFADQGRYDLVKHKLFEKQKEKTKVDAPFLCSIVDMIVEMEP